MAGTRITQQDPNALPGRRYGSFAGKTAAPVVAVHRRMRRRWAWYQSWSAGILAVIMDKLTLPV